MSNELKVLDQGLSIADHALSIKQRIQTAGDVKTERKAANKMQYAFHTFEGARNFIDNSPHLSSRDKARCEALLDEFTYLAMEDIRSTRKGW